MSIRWSKSDYVRLGKAVADFNRQISANTTQENKLYLPKEINYKELRDEIKTRQGLEAYIQQLKRINLEGSFALEKLEGGAVVTRYQRRELQRALAQVVPELESKIQAEQIKTLKSYGKLPTDTLDEPFKGYQQKKLEARLKDYKELFTLSGEKFRSRAKQLMINQTEKKYRQAYQFRKNYMKEMQKYRNFRDYWIFKKYYADRHKDPVRFYEDLPDDDTYFPDDLYYQSDVVYTEEQFTAFVENIIGMSVDEIYEKEGLKRNQTGEELKYQKTQESEAKKEKATIKSVNSMFKKLR